MKIVCTRKTLHASLFYRMASVLGLKGDCLQLLYPSFICCLKYCFACCFCGSYIQAPSFCVDCQIILFCHSLPKDSCLSKTSHLLPFTFFILLEKMRYHCAHFLALLPSTLALATSHPYQPRNKAPNLVSLRPIQLNNGTQHDLNRRASEHFSNLDIRTQEELIYGSPGGIFRLSYSERRQNV